MNQNGPNKQSAELLSAYCDGELTAEEEAQVEQWLSDSAEARRELDEIRRLSRLLHEQPRHSAPVELAASIRRRAEREMLLPDRDIVRTNSPSSRRRFLGVGSLVGAVVAVLILAYVVLSPSQQDRRSLREKASPQIARLDEKGVATRAESESTVSQKTQRPNDSRPEKSNATAKPAGAPADRDPSPRQVASNESFKPQADEQATPSASPQQAPSQDLKFKRPDDESLSELLASVKTAGQRVAVLELTVTEARRSLAAMQRLLQGHDGSVASRNIRNMARSSAESEAQPRAHHLPALYVESSPRQLASALNALARADLLLDWKVGPHREMDQIQIAARERMQTKGPRDKRTTNRKPTPLAEAITREKQSGSKKTQGAVKAQGSAATGRPKKPMPREDRRQDAPVVAEKPSPAKRAKRAASPMPMTAGSKSQAGQSFHLEVRVLAPSLEGRGEDAQRMARPLAQADRDQKPKASRKPQPDQQRSRSERSAQSARLSAKPLRVLLIFRPSADHRANKPGAQEQ